ncbi:MAG: GtrA family protein [Oscillospiraceae bacterium]|jgi:putative flippase GtrA|nr:GtrA family protein [Oscillospiraceae bacterium]
MPGKLKKTLREKRELCLYVFFGGLTTATSFSTYFLARWVFFTGESTSPAVAFSWVCAVTFAYITNRIWVFESKEKRFWRIAREAALFYAARLFTFAADLLMMYLLVDLTGVSNARYELFARVCVSAVVLTLNYILSKLVVFRKKKAKSKTDKTS